MIIWIRYVHLEKDANYISLGQYIWFLNLFPVGSSPFFWNIIFSIWGFLFPSPALGSRWLPNGEFSPPTTGHLPQSSQVRPQQPNNTSSKRIFTSQWKKWNEAWKEIFSDTRSQSLRFWKTAEADAVVNEACLCLLFLTFDQFSSCHFAHWLLVISSLA